MVTLKFEPLSEDYAEQSFEVVAPNFARACCELLRRLGDEFFVDEVEDTDEMFAEAFPVLEALADEAECSATREDFSTPEQNYRITRSET